MEDFLRAMRISSVISIFQKIKNSPCIMNARKVLRKFFDYFFVTCKTSDQDVEDLAYFSQNFR